MIKTFKSGPHAHRTPLSYPALRPLFQGDIVQVEHPDDADLLIFAHSIDILNVPLDVIHSWRQYKQPIVLLSEEPFWDTIWGRQPGLRHLVLDTAHGSLPVVQLNHQTSPIFAFDRIPYYLLTNHRFAVSYRSKFQRNSAVSATQWQQRFSQYVRDLVFMFERRPEPHHNVSWNPYDLVGLCAWRTEVAQSCQTGRIERHGHSWSATTPKRQECLDWHLDKLVRLDSNQRILAAFENTHHPKYVSEKYFDAFACGALPAYFASPNHRIHTLSLPADSWINCHGLSSEDAAQHLIDSISAMQHEHVAEAYAAAQKTLYTLIDAPENWLNERKRLRQAVLDELETILS